MAFSLPTPKGLYRSVRSKLFKPTPTPEGSSSSDSDNVAYNVPNSMLEAHASRIKARYPEAGDTWVRNKAASKLQQGFKKELKNEVVAAMSGDSEDSLEYDSSRTISTLKTPISRFNNESFLKHKEILTNMDCPEKLSNQLLNPITKADRIRLISKFMKEYDESPLSKHRARSMAFQMAMLHTELAIIHQLIVDRIHPSMIRKNNRWAIRSCFEPELSFNSPQAEKEAISFMNEFRDEFEQLLRLTQLLQPGRISVLSFQEVMGILFYLSQDENTMESWPVTLATGSKEFSQLYSNMLESSFTPHTARRRYDLINSSRLKKSPDITARKNRSLLESLHFAANPNQSPSYTDEETSWIEELTQTYHPDLDELPTAPTLPPSYDSGNHVTDEDAVYDLRGLCSQPDLERTPYVDILEQLNKGGANLTLDPSHARATVDISNIPDYSRVRIGDIMNLCHQAILTSRQGFNKPPCYTPLPPAHLPRGHYQQYRYLGQDPLSIDPRTSTRIPFSPGTPETPPMTLSPILNLSPPKPYKTLPQADGNVTTGVYPPLPTNPGQNKKINNIVEQIASLRRRIDFETSRTQSDDHFSLQVIRKMRDELTEKVRELYSFLGIMTDDKGQPITEAIKEETSSQDITDIKRKLGDLSSQITDLSIRQDLDRSTLYDSQSVEQESQQLDDYKRYYDIPESTASPQALSLKVRMAEPRRPRGRPPANPVQPAQPAAAISLAEQRHQEAGEEGVRRAREAYKQIKPFKIDDNADAFIRRVQAQLPGIYPNPPSDGVVYEFLYNKCDEEVQEMILKDKSVQIGDVNALRNFLLTKAGRTPQPHKDLDELKRAKNKKSWRQIILKVEKSINDQLDGIEAKPDVKARQFQFREKILEFCDPATKHDLRQLGLIRPKELRYAEFCQYLFDMDADEEQNANRDLRYMQVTDNAPYQDSNLQQSPQLSQLLEGIQKNATSTERQGKEVSRIANEMKKLTSSLKVAPADTPRTDLSQQQYASTAERDQQNQRNPQHRPPQGNPTPPLRRQDAFRVSKRNQDFYPKPSPPKARFCDLCGCTTRHLITHCPRLVWSPRVTPLPPGANSDCPPTQYCYASDGQGQHCKDRAHYTKYCPKYQYIVKDDTS